MKINKMPRLRGVCASACDPAANENESHFILSSAKQKKKKERKARVRFQKKKAELKEESMN